MRMRKSSGIRELAAAIVCISCLSQSSLSGIGDASYLPVEDLAMLSPTLDYSTFLGGSSVDSIRGCVRDSAGNIWLTGYTGSYDFPTTADAYDRTYNGGANDGFLVKLSPEGKLLYSTFYGGSDQDAIQEVALDSEGNAWVGGATMSPNLPTTANALSRTCGGGRDAFIAKFSSSGAFLYGSYVGGNGWDYGFTMTVDKQGCVYVGGKTHGSFPVTSGSAQPNFGGALDAFLIKLKVTADRSSIIFSTYLGGYDEEAVHGLATDDSGNVYAVGGTQSPNFPTTPGAFKTSQLGLHYDNLDAFVVKLDGNGRMLYSTLVGSSTHGVDLLVAVLVDAEGNVYAAGQSSVSEFPVTANAVQRNFAGGKDAVLIKLNSAGSSLLYSTYFGGTGNDEAEGIAMDGAGHVYIAGWSSSANLRMVDAVQGVNMGSYDVFMAEFTADGSGLLQSTYLGGASNDGEELWQKGLAVDNAGNVYIAGQTAASTFPITGDALQGLYRGGVDGFLTKIGASLVDDLPPVITVPANITVEQTGPQGAVVSFTCSAADDTDPNPTITVTPPSGSMFPQGETVVTVTARDASGNAASKTFKVTVRDTTPPTIIMVIAPASLWPPNHQMVDAMVRLTATDSCTPDLLITLSVSQDEPVEDRTGDGNFAPDAVIVRDATGKVTGLQLRAERDGALNGRVYMVTATATDASGNVTRKSCTAVVPKSQNRADIGAVTREAAAAVAAGVPLPYDSTFMPITSSRMKPRVRKSGWFDGVMRVL